MTWEPLTNGRAVSPAFASFLCGRRWGRLIATCHGFLAECLPMWYILEYQIKYKSNRKNTMLHLSLCNMPLASLFLIRKTSDQSGFPLDRFCLTLEINWTPTMTSTLLRIWTRIAIYTVKLIKTPTVVVLFTQKKSKIPKTVPTLKAMICLYM